MRTTPSVACLISAVIPPIAENSLGVMLFSAEFVARSWFDFTDSVYYEFYHIYFKRTAHFRREGG
jgi:hypothetical protein